MIFEQVLAGEEFGVSDAKPQPLLAPHPVPPRRLPSGRRTSLPVINYDSSSKSLCMEGGSYLCLSLPSSLRISLLCAVQGQFVLVFAVSTI